MTRAVAGDTIFMQVTTKMVLSFLINFTVRMLRNAVYSRLRGWCARHFARHGRKITWGKSCWSLEGDPSRNCIAIPRCRRQPWSVGRSCGRAARPASQPPADLDANFDFLAQIADLSGQNIHLAHLNLSQENFVRGSPRNFGGDEIDVKHELR